MTLNNRQLHPKEKEWIEQNARRFARQLNSGKEPTAADVIAAERILAQYAYNVVQNGAPPIDEKLALAAQYFLGSAPKIALPDNGHMFYALPQVKLDTGMYGEYGDPKGFNPKNGLNLPTPTNAWARATANARTREVVGDVTNVSGVIAATLAVAPAAIPAAAAAARYCYSDLLGCGNKLGIFTADVFSEVPHGISIGAVGAVGTKAVLMEFPGPVKLAPVVESVVKNPANLIDSIVISPKPMESLVDLLAVTGKEGPVRPLVISEWQAIAQNLAPCCFAPGTLVATPNGYTAIEKLKFGDKV